MPHFIQADWSAPRHVHAYTSLRTEGCSHAAYESFNLAQHVGDVSDDVEKNRDLLQKTLHLPVQPYWLQQTHSTLVVCADDSRVVLPNADASFARQAKRVCAVLSADCLPLLLCDRQGSVVAAVHAGWKGLLNGVIENTLAAMRVPADQLWVWLGPAISQSAYPVGEEMRDQFIAAHAEAIHGFKRGETGQWHADLYALARQRLQCQGVLPTAISGGTYCTYTDTVRFYSARRDSIQTGRMVSLIWFE